MDKTAYDVIGVVADYSTNPIESRLVTPKIFVPLPDGGRRRRRHSVR